MVMSAPVFRLLEVSKTASVWVSSAISVSLPSPMRWAHASYLRHRNTQARTAALPAALLSSPRPDSSAAM